MGLSSRERHCARSCRIRIRPRTMFTVPLAGLLLMIQTGCGIYRLDPSKPPRLFGVGTIEEQPTQEGNLYRVTLPGIGVRSSYLGNGVSLGWHESLVFCVEKQNADHDIDCFADQVSSVGLDVSGGGLTLGYSREFKVPLPDPETQILQSIIYSEQQPENTQIIQRHLQ